ncbi:hypothetical protein ZYGR_0A03400 [Zygosaccharomyces rouxii]|uniref:ZYRO0A07744p n=2 Tax=Zygosaccharomyces rouxii TaxID=4956 RepID=C5DQ10_ZYGRC|nr:uncharacterized protein ZYRO0A07744g [Zygosaccharomyces rouxii]GAV46745.1 hypothetical protein ZYGR_0A03400 [Zygosaccharomyces rouxii]CAR25771.1 ZYRO0A07744p [Zygosaccharomyces rouxii]
MSHRLKVLPYLIKHTPKAPILSQNLIQVYAFDLDHTLIQPISSSTFSKTAEDWQFVKYGNRNSIDTLLQLVRDEPNSLIVVFSNQGGVLASPPDSKSCIKYLTKIELVLKHIATMAQGDQLLNRLWIYASPKAPARIADRSMFIDMRKPATGMMNQFQQDIGSLPIELKYYCGDAAGRPTDFSDSDVKFAHNLHTIFKLPEDLFIT